MLLGIAVALLVGLLASNYVYRQLKRAAAVKPIITDQVVVAATTLGLGARLQANELRVIAWPAGHTPAGSFSRLEDCIGRALITQVVENEPILDQKLAPREAGAGLPAAIPEGMRAVSVRVDDVVSVAGFTMPGTMVDVLVTGDAGNGGGNSVTRNILEDVRVLAAGQQIQQDKDGKPQTVGVVTLLVDPEQANKLAMASTNGKIQLSLRNTIDAREMKPPPVYRSNLFGGEPPVLVAVKRKSNAGSKPPIYTVEIIRGDKRESENLPAQ
jgi:pilus assembly protein CpaB